MWKRLLQRNNPFSPILAICINCVIIPDHPISLNALISPEHKTLGLPSIRNPVSRQYSTSSTPSEFKFISRRSIQPTQTFTAVPYSDRPSPHLLTYSQPPFKPGYSATLRPYHQFARELQPNNYSSPIPCTADQRRRIMTSPPKPIPDVDDDDDETYGFSKLRTQSTDNLCDQLERNINHLAAVDRQHHQQTVKKQSRKLSSTFLASRMKLVSQRTQKLFQRFYQPSSDSVDRDRRPSISSPILLDDHHYPAELKLKPIGRNRRSLSYGHLPDPILDQLEIKNAITTGPDKVLSDDADSGILVNDSGQSSIVCESTTYDGNLIMEEPTLKFIQLEINDSVVDRSLGITVEPSRHSWVGFEITHITPGGLVGINGNMLVGDELVSLMGEPVRNLNTLEMKERLLSCTSDSKVTDVEITVARRLLSNQVYHTPGIRRQISFAEESPAGLIR